MHGQNCKGLACILDIPPPDPGSFGGSNRPDNVCFFDFRPCGERPRHHYQLGSDRHIATVLATFRVPPPAGFRHVIEGGTQQDGFLQTESGDTVVVRAVPNLGDADPDSPTDEPRPGPAGPPPPDDDYEHHDNEGAHSDQTAIPRTDRSRSPSSRRPFPPSGDHTSSTGETCCKHSMRGQRAVSISSEKPWPADPTESSARHPCTEFCGLQVFDCLPLQVRKPDLGFLGWAGEILKLAPRTAKGPSAPSLSSHPSVHEAHNQATQLAPAAERPPPYQLPTPELTVPQPEEAVAADILPARLWHFVILGHNITKEYVELSLRVPSTVGQAIAAVASARNDSRQFLYGALTPVFPQPACDFATLVAMPHWASMHNAVCIDARACDGRIFSIVIPGGINRDSLLRAAGFDITGAFEMYYRDSWVPWRPNDWIDLEHGSLITILPSTQLYRPGLSLQQMLLQRAGRTEHPTLPTGNIGRFFWVPTDAMPCLFDARTVTRDNSRQELARLLRAEISSLSVQTPKPMIGDFDHLGRHCEKTIVATEQICRLPIPPARRQPPVHICVLDLRPILKGVGWVLTRNNKIHLEPLVATLSDGLPVGFHINVVGGSLEHGRDCTWVHVGPGQVLIAHFVADPDADSVDDEDLSDPDGPPGDDQDDPDYDPGHSRDHEEPPTGQATQAHDFLSTGNPAPTQDLDGAEPHNQVPQDGPDEKGEYDCLLVKSNTAPANFCSDSPLSIVALQDTLPCLWEIKSHTHQQAQERVEDILLLTLLWVAATIHCWLFCFYCLAIQQSLDHAGSYSKCPTGIVCKQLREPQPTNMSDLNRLESLRSITRRSMLEWPYLQWNGDPQEPLSEGDDTATDTSAFQAFVATLFIFKIDYQPERVHLYIDETLTEAQLLAQLQEARDDRYGPDFPCVRSVHPQPHQAWGALIAVPDWEEGEQIAVLDLLRIDGRIYATQLLPTIDRAGLLFLADLPATSTAKVFIGAELEPLQDAVPVVIQAFSPASLLCPILSRPRRL